MSSRLSRATETALDALRGGLGPLSDLEHQREKPSMTIRYDPTDTGA